MRFGIIGGTGFYQAGQEIVSERAIETPYGAAQVTVFRVGGEEVAFLPRHGQEHGIAPHQINYRANIAALKSLGVTNVLATAAVGSLNRVMAPGEFALLNQFLDFTWGREVTFFDAGEVKHFDMTEPYCPQLRQTLLTCALVREEVIHPEAVYVCTQGPRFETPAEIEMFSRLGGDLVGMTGVPEVTLAREAGLCYAAMALITNWAAGIAARPLSHGEVSEFSRQRAGRLRELFFALIGSYTETDCSCCRPAEAG